LISSKITIIKKIHWIKIFSIIIFSLFISCENQIHERKLAVEKDKHFHKLNFRKIWEIEFPFIHACFPCPNGILCVEIMDRGWSEFKFHLYDYSGKLIKEKLIKSGNGPNEMRVLDYHTAWISSGKIHFIDIGSYHKILDPKSFEIKTVSKLSNVIKGYGNKYTIGKFGLTSLENSGEYIITSFESTAFHENFTYYIAKSKETFDDLSIITKAKKTEPWTWYKLGESKSYTDYYGAARLDRIFTVDWERDVIYYLPNIEEPEIKSLGFDGKEKKEFILDIHFRRFEIDRDELEFYHEYILGETDSKIRGNFDHILHIPPHAPPLMNLKVIHNWLIIITGNRNWDTGENQAHVYKLPSLEYEGSFYIPFSNRLRIKWIDGYYITKNLIEKKDEPHFSFSVYKIEEK